MLYPLSYQGWAASCGNLWESSAPQDAFAPQLLASARGAWIHKTGEVETPPVMLKSV